MSFKCDAAPLAIKYTLATHFINKHWNRLNPPNTLELILLATCYGQHVSEISSKATKTLGFLRHNLALAHQHTKEVAYQTLVRPQLEYAAPIWHPYNETETKKAEKVQLTAARWVCRPWHNTSSVEEMLDDLDWPSLEDCSFPLLSFTRFTPVQCLLTRINI